jgi:hypothetical protein
MITAKIGGPLLYVYLGSSAGYSQFVGHSNEFRQRSSAHLSHDLAPMNANCDLAGAKVGGGLLVREARDHEGKDFPFARSKKVKMPPQFGQFRSLLARSSINSNRSVNRF